MTGMKKKLASLLLMLTLIMCQMPTLVFANDVPADVPPTDQQEQTVGQDDQNDQNGQPAGGQMNLANAGNNEEGTDGQNGDDVSKEQTTGNDANGTNETNGGDNADGNNALRMNSTPVNKVPATFTTAGDNVSMSDLHVYTPGHGKVMVDGQDSGTDYTGRKTTGANVQIEAVPSSGYSFSRWVIYHTTGNPSLVHNASTTVTAGTDTEAAASFGLTKAPVTVTPPTVGSSGSSNPPSVAVPSGAGYSVEESFWVGEGSALGSLILITPSTFEAGKTYYMYVKIHDGADSFSSGGAGGVFDTQLDVTGGTKQVQGTWSQQDGIVLEAIITVTPSSATEHNVTFDAQGGTLVPAVQKVAHGGHATKPADPSKNGFHILGWFTKTPDKLTREDVYANTPPGFNFANTAINEDTQLHAAWYAGFYGATYDLSAATPKYAETGGKVTFTSVYQQKPDASRVWWNYSNIQGSQVTVTAIPEQGAHFVGWAPATLDANDNMPDTPPSRDKIVSTDSTYTFTFNGKTALAAMFERDNVTIEFNTHGATTETPANQVITCGGKATAPAEPVKSPFAFKGWFDNADHTGNPVNFSSATFDKDTTLHAAWANTLLVHVFDKTTKSTTKGGKVKIDGGSPSTSISQQLFEGDSATITATPDTGYRFVGWSTNSSDPAGNIISTKTSYQISNYDGTLTQLWAVFEEEPPVLTLHWSSVDGKDLMDPIKIEAPKGTTIDVALKSKYGDDWTLDKSVFPEDGYKDSKFRTKNPITNYTSETEMQADSVSGDTAINADTDIYYIMYKKIDKVSAGIESPVCGTETANGTQSVPYDQTNPPAVSVTSGKGYKLFMADSKPYAFWTVNRTETTPFVGMFKGDETYYARFRLLADFGYVFSERPTATLDNAEVTLVQVEDATNQKNLIVGGAVKADHNWGEWEVTKEPTETEEGLEERTCKTVDCGAHEERTIPKLVVEYRFVSGDGSSWTRGSTEKLNFVVKRNRADETTVDHFKGLKVDGKEVPSSGYAAKAGSVVIDLMPAYLGTLADGEHTLTAVFDDGNKETSASFKILSAADKGSKDKANSNKKGSPATGDDAQMLIWLMILCTAGLALSDRIIRRLKNDSAGR